MENLNVQTMVELLEAFRDNRTHHRSYMRDMMTTHFKKVMLDRWHEEVDYNQRTLFNLMKEMDHL